LKIREITVKLKDASERKSIYVIEKKSQYSHGLELLE
jgi:hypothetical protein